MLHVGRGYMKALRSSGDWLIQVGVAGTMATIAPQRDLVVLQLQQVGLVEEAGGGQLCEARAAGLIGHAVALHLCQADGRVTIYVLVARQTRDHDLGG